MLKKTEAQIQASFFQEINLYPKVRPYIFAIPNGGYRRQKSYISKDGKQKSWSPEAKKLKQQGVTPGVPDVFLSLPNKLFHGLYIEFKAGKNKPTIEQYDMIDNLRKAGYRCEVCYSEQEAMDIVMEYLNDQP